VIEFIAASLASASRPSPVAVGIHSAPYFCAPASLRLPQPGLMHSRRRRSGRLDRWRLVRLRPVTDNLARGEQEWWAGG
jgi:hypothetical protein